MALRHLGRRVTEEEALTASGTWGDGIPLPPIVRRWEFDPNGNVTALIDPLERRREQVYDARDKRRIVRYPDLSEDQFSYDGDGNLILTIDPNGTVQRLTVDPLNRTTRMDVVASLNVEGMTFAVWTFDGLGRCLSEENDFARTEIQVNSLGWADAETVTVTQPAASFRGPLQLQREFDDDGSILGLTYPGGRLVRYHRNRLGQVVGVEDLVLGSGYPGIASAQAPRDVINLLLRATAGCVRAGKRLARQLALRRTWAVD